MESTSFEHNLAEAVHSFQCGDHARSVSLFEPMLMENPERSDIRLVIVQIYQSIGNQQKTLEHASYLVRHHPDVLSVEVQIQVLGLCVGMGDRAQAIELLQLVSRRNAESPTVQESLFSICCALGMMDSAMMILRRLLFLRPELGENDNKKHVSHTISAKLERLQRTIDQLQDELRTEQDCAQYEYGDHLREFFRANALATTGQLAEAIDIYKTLQVDHPGFDEVLVNIGVVSHTWAAQGHQSQLYGEAAKYFLTYLQKHPEDVAVLFLLARTVQADGQLARLYGSARELYGKVLEREPDHIHALYNLADIIQRAGDMQLSYDYFGRYMRVRDAQAKAHPLGKLGVRFLDETVSYAMGHLAFLPDIYKKTESIGWRQPTETVILAPSWFTANKTLLDHWKRHYCVVEDPKMIRELRPLAEKLLYDSSFCPLPDGTYRNARTAVPWIEQAYEKLGKPPLLELDANLRDRGWKILQKIGIERGSKFVIVHVRNSGFKNEGVCAHNGHRNSDISSYLYAIEQLIRRGYWVIRMGEATAEPLAPRPRMFEYSHSEYKCDWMDVFLCAEATLFLGTSGGLFATPQTFGTPLVCTNYPPTYLQHTSRDLFIPKMMRWTRENRLVSFREALSAPLVQSESGGLFSELGIEFLDNTPDEIWELTEEMLARFDGSLGYTDDDQELQERFRALTAAGGGLSICRIGRNFLRKYRDLLN